jgi:hypothetical protein
MNVLHRIRLFCLSPEPGEVETLCIETHITINLRSVIMIKNHAIEEYKELVSLEDVYTNDIPTDEEMLLYNYAIILVPREHL